MMKLNIMIDEYKDYYESDVINNDKETKQDKNNDSFQWIFRFRV